MEFSERKEVDDIITFSRTFKTGGIATVETMFRDSPPSDNEFYEEDIASSQIQGPEQVALDTNAKISETLEDILQDIDEIVSANNIRMSKTAEQEDVKGQEIQHESHEKRGEKDK